MKLRIVEPKKCSRKNRTDILSTIDMAAEKSLDIIPDWEHNSTLKRGIIVMLLPYYEILQEKKKKSK